MKHYWITDGYDTYLKEHKKGHTDKRFMYYLKKRFELEGTNLDEICSTPAVIKELFLQTWHLRMLMRFAFETMIKIDRKVTDAITK